MSCADDMPDGVGPDHGAIRGTPPRFSWLTMWASVHVPTS